MQEFAVRVTEQYEIVAEAARPSDPPRVLKQGDTFCVFGRRGDMIPADGGEQGLFHDGTRYLSHFEILLGPSNPLLLSSTVSEDNILFTADMTNADLRGKTAIVLPHGEIHLLRSRVLFDGGSVERLRVSSFAAETVEVPLMVRFAADFADIFEVRGTRRERRGAPLPAGSEAHRVLRYAGLDGVERRTHIRWTLAPTTIEAGLIVFLLRLDPQAVTTIDLSATCESGDQSRPAPDYDAVLEAARESRRLFAVGASRLTSQDGRLDRWIRRSTADLDMMISDTPYGFYPYAGIPWFSTPFGRDGILTAFELLWSNPEVARGVLGFLAATQATTHADAQDAQPGKILHEMRGGEMAALGEVPFGRYYGTVDATPLFVMLADAYMERTGDRDTIDRLWPHIEQALHWMETSGDVDGDGFIEYARRSPTGLVQQGWKDSQDSVFHADGRLAEPPIALCEVQGYAYGAWHGAARLAAARGDAAAADTWHARAERLAVQFDEAFWCDDLGTYALALDRYKRPCRVKTSNAGHCLFAGIARPDRARRIAETIMTDDAFGGWGVRTVAACQRRYNPMSYHNGSVWPHDNAMVAAGLSRYGFTAAAARILDAMFNLSQIVDLHRLPELICGFHRRGSEHPTLYPVACAPQAWAAGAVYMLLQASLGLHIDAAARRVSFTKASLPESIESFEIANLRIGDATVDLRVKRHPYDVGIRVTRRVGDVEITTVR